MVARLFRQDVAFSHFSDYNGPNDQTLRLEAAEELRHAITLADLQRADVTLTDPPVRFTVQDSTGTVWRSRRRNTKNAIRAWQEAVDRYREFRRREIESAEHAKE
jgi:hypothetical protein